MIPVSGPRHRLGAPVVDQPWSVVGNLLPPKPPVLRRVGRGALEVFIWLFGSDDWGRA